MRLLKTSDDISLAGHTHTSLGSPRIVDGVLQGRVEVVGLVLKGSFDAVDGHDLVRPCPIRAPDALIEDLGQEAAVAPVVNGNEVFMRVLLTSAAFHDVLGQRLAALQHQDVPRWCLGQGHLEGSLEREPIIGPMESRCLISGR